MPPRINTGIIGTAPKWTAEITQSAPPFVALTPPAVAGDGTIYCVGGEHRFKNLHGNWNTVAGLLWAFDDTPSYHGPRQTGAWPFGGSKVTGAGSSSPVEVRIGLKGGPLVGWAGYVFVLGTRHEIHWTSYGNPPELYGRTVKIEHLLFGINGDGGIYSECLLASERPADGKPVPKWRSLAHSLDGTLHFVQGNNLVSVFMDGSSRSEMELPFVASDGIGPPAIGPDGMLYFAAEGSVWKIDARQQSYIWQINPPGAFSDTSELCIGPDSTVYVGMMSGQVVAITSDGVLKWQSPVLGSRCTTPVLGTDGVIHVGTFESLGGSGRRLHRLDASGGLIGSVECSSLLDPVAVGSDGWVYAACQLESRLYAFTPAGPGEEQGLLPVANRPFGSPAIQSRSDTGPHGTLYLSTWDYFLTSTLVAVNIISPSASSSCWSTGRSSAARTNSAQTLEVPPEWTAAYKQVLPKRRDLLVLRRFRDKVVAPDPVRGNKYLSLLYRDSGQLLDVIQRDKALLKQANALVRSNLVSIAGVLAGKKGAIKDPAAVLDFLHRLSSASKPSLQRLCRRVSADLKACQRRGVPFLGLQVPRVKPGRSATK